MTIISRLVDTSSPPAAAAVPNRPIRVFVQLARGFGAASWRERWERGAIIGLNEHLPYGFFWAAEEGCVVEHSEDRHESPAGTALRLALRLILGFDLLHAWRNRRGIYAADIVWTGTESQCLAVLLLLRCGRRRDRPKVIAQSVWLLDSWPRFSPLKRWLYRSLIADAAALTVHSPASLKTAEALFPRRQTLFMPYGITADNLVPPRRKTEAGAIRVLSAGSDRHRDWATLVEAVRDRPEFELRIVAPRLPADLRLSANISLLHPATNDEYIGLYRWADVVALALHPNLHGSGITVVEEATVLGLPVVASDAGALRGGYFSDREVRFVPISDPPAMREAIVAVARDETSVQMVERAQRRMIDDGLTSRGVARRYAKLSRGLLAGA